MIKLFLSFLRKQNIAYRITNGYENIVSNVSDASDHDILFTKDDFKNIEHIILEFSTVNDIKVVQKYHQGKYAKNFFLYDPRTKQLLNLDLYGEISRLKVTILNEKDVFENELQYNGFSILQPEQEFIQYLVKKIDKGNISLPVFEKLQALFFVKKEECENYVKFFFQDSHPRLIEIFETSNYNLMQQEIKYFKSDFENKIKTAKEGIFSKITRVFNRIIFPTGIAIAFLGPDGSGKSTIIEGLRNKHLPFRRDDYFHLKPILKKGNSEDNSVVTDPHASKPYSPLKSYSKLGYFIYQYNIGWLKNIFLLKRKSSLVIFDRYFDDLLVDSKRYRYGGNKNIANVVKYFIPRPTLYFVLTAEANIIYSRKQEVSKNELSRQLEGYSNLVDGRRYIGVDVSKEPSAIVDEIYNTIMMKMNERY